jgi:FlaA1/EpsC-like NDP-sugar epimerase/lipopolysaccharide/colanic/teichoic acid biosynthesis glycosyltransferase
MFYFSKRTLDILFSIVGTLIFLPLLPLLAALIKLDSKGPVFYKSERIGKNGEALWMYKFRTMVEIPVQVGTSLSPEGDVRVTDFGRFLRRTKLNELPQLLNVLKGDMSIVGPRPEAPDLAAAYPPEAQILFSVKPGLVGPGQIFYRNEGELYPDGVDPKDYYIQKILPEKLGIEARYVENPTFLKDLKYIFLAAKETLFGSISRRHFFENRSQIYLFIFDMFFVIGCYLFAIELRFEGEIDPTVFPILAKAFPILLFYRVLCFVGFGLYGVLIRFLNTSSYVAVAKAVTLSSIFTAVTVYGLGYLSFPRSLLIIDWLCLTFFMISIRIPSKLIRFKLYGDAGQGKRHVLIYGAGDKGTLAAGQLKENVKIVGFLDDDRSKRNKKINEYAVMGNRYDIESLSKIYRVNEVVIAISNLDEKNLNHIVSLCHKASVRYSIFTTVVDSYTDRMREEYLRNKKIFQWIGGKEIHIDPDTLKSTFSNKTLLLLGASNILGLELLKYITSLNPRKVYILDRYEAYLNEMFKRAMTFLPREQVKPMLTNESLPEAAKALISEMDKSCIVMHMGTRKYPPLMQADPVTVVKENILDTWDLLQTTRLAGYELFLMTSYIGALKPDNIVHSSLRLAEHYMGCVNSNSRTKTGIVRLYNLVENRGSILRTIQSQLRDTRKVILDHPEEERYFSTASSAAKLILESAHMAINNQDGVCGTYMPCFNGPVKVHNLAKLIIQDYGLDPDRDVEISFINSGNGESWKEEIQLDGTQQMSTSRASVPRRSGPKLKRSKT